MVNIEEYIKKIKTELDTEELSFDHEANFQKKLKVRFPNRDTYILRYAVAVAASVLIFVATSVYIYTTKNEGYRGAVQTSQWVEFLEAEQYYTKQSEDAYSKLKETLSAQPRDVASPLLSEIEEMESSYKQLKKDLKNNPNDIRLMSAVVQYHQLKLDLLNNLIERFTLYSNNKLKQNEKSNI